MTDRLNEVLKHQYIYVPRGTDKDTIQLGKRLGLAVAREHHAHLTVLASRKDSATFHPELAKQDIVTERSGYVGDGGVVLAWCPTYRVMEKIHHLQKSVIVLVEWIPGEFETWAKIHQAYNVLTSALMDAGLTPETTKAIEAIVFEGYNGWTKSIDVQITRNYLGELAKVGRYDRELVLAYARQTKSEHSIARLKKILDEFEASRTTTAAVSSTTGFARAVGQRPQQT